MKRMFTNLWQVTDPSQGTSSPWGVHAFLEDVCCDGRWVDVSFLWVWLRKTSLLKLCCYENNSKHIVTHCDSSLTTDGLWHKFIQMLERSRRLILTPAAATCGWGGLKLGSLNSRTTLGWLKLAQPAHPTNVNPKSELSFQDLKVHSSKTKATYTRYTDSHNRHSPCQLKQVASSRLHKLKGTEYVWI